MPATRPPGRDGQRPLPAGETFFTPGAGPLRQEVERRSAVIALWLYGRPRWIAGTLPLLLVLATLFVRGPLVLFPGVLLIAFVAWVTFLAWPVLGAGGRLARLGVLALTVALIAGNGLR